MTRPLDRIRIHELTARTYVGFNDWERTKKQDVAISLTLYADLSDACRSDAVAHTVDYKDIKQRILSAVEAGRFMLIEKMAEDIAHICLEHPKVVRVDVSVNKLGALRFAKSVSVEITREAENDRT